MPLVLTVAVASAGVAAWVWSQRKDEDHETAEAEAAYQDLDYENADYGDNPAYGASGGPGGPNPAPFGGPGVRELGQGQKDNAGWGAQMTGALRRTPSPQQFLDSAKKTVAAGVTAAGAAVGSALAAIREEDKNAYADHETWSEEADAKKERTGPSQKDASKRRKKVAIVVSADNHLDDVDSDGYHEHAVSFFCPRLMAAIGFSAANLPASLSCPTSPRTLIPRRSSFIFSSMHPISRIPLLAPPALFHHPP